MGNQMKNWLWFLLLPSLAFAKWPASANMRKDPVYIDVQPDQIVIYPEKMEIAASALAVPHNGFEEFLDQVEQVRSVRYSVFVLRPGSVDLQRRVRQLMQDRNLELGFEPVETGRDFMEVAQNPAYNLSVTSHLSADQTARVVEFFYSKRSPYEIEVRSNSLTILTNQVVVTREEMHVAGNPFEQYLDQYRAQKSQGFYPHRISQGPYSYRKEPGSDEFFAELMEYSYEHGARKGVWDTVMAGIPMEVPANGRAPVYLECRSNRLFAISADTPAREYEISNLKTLDPATQYICFLVRPDSFDVFRQARKEAWECNLDVSCELQDASGPFAIGPEGQPLFPP